MGFYCINDFENSLDLWDICGTFGELNGSVAFGGKTVKCETNEISVSTKTEKSKHGVFSRITTVKNISDKPIYLSCLLDKFRFGGGEWEAYTQFNGWQSESIGAWQSVNTKITAESSGVRTSVDAAPFLSLWNNQTNRGIVFHLVPDFAWEINAKRVSETGGNNHIEVTAGLNSHDLSFSLNPNETVTLPEILYYEATDKLSLDCWKLHRYINEKYKRKSMPVIYNTWLAFFDHFDFEKIKSQIKPAADIGVEYFVIDAGWFGKKDAWVGSRGDWYEIDSGALCGRMKEISDLVRAEKMKFGIWLELETADVNCKSVKNNPDLYIFSHGTYLLDFSKEEAISFALTTASSLIEKYNAEYFKFDFNSTLLYDAKHKAFGEYMSGYNKFLKLLKEKYPKLYVERCASGGMRMNLADGRYCDSFWLSDNQNPQAGIRIVKDTVKRLPPQWIERWAAIASLPDFKPTYSNQREDKILTVDDAVWGDLRSVKLQFLENFLIGGVFGLSCNLTNLSDSLIADLKKMISSFKSEREFWLDAECRILTDTDTMLVFQYNDKEYDKAEILAFSFRSMQDSIFVYPKLDDNKMYFIDEKQISGKEICENGIKVSVAGQFDSSRTEIVSKSH